MPGRPRPGSGRADGGAGGSAAALASCSRLSFEQVEDLCAQRDMAEQVLDALEHGGDIVATAGVEREFLNRHLAEDELRVVDDAHGVFRTKIVLKSRRFRLEAQ